MRLKKSLLTLLILMGLASGASFAGKEDWNGLYKLRFGDQVIDASHTSTKVQFLFFSAGKCVNLQKGSKINGVEIKDDVRLCTDNNITQFSQELQKLGAIVSQDVKPGPTYQE